MAITNAGKDFVAAQVGGTAGTTAQYLALSASAVGAATATTLSGEITTSGLARALATYGHSANTAIYTLSKTFQTGGTDSLPVTIAKCGVFTAASGGTLVFETGISPAPTLTVSGDQLTLTETITISSS